MALVVKDMSSDDSVTIRIPEDLHRKIVKRVEESRGEFRDVAEYVEFVLRELLKEEEPESDYTSEDEKEIKKRLRSLGYM